MVEIRIKGDYITSVQTYETNDIILAQVQVKDKRTEWAIQGSEITLFNEKDDDITGSVEFLNLPMKDYVVTIEVSKYTAYITIFDRDLEFKNHQLEGKLI